MAGPSHRLRHSEMRPATPACSNPSWADGAHGLRGAADADQEPSPSELDQSEAAARSGPAPAGVRPEPITLDEATETLLWFG